MDHFLMKASVKPMTPLDARMMNPLKLAFLGDAIFEAYVRTYIISKYTLTVHELSKATVRFVKASAQAQVVRSLEPLLSEEEMQMIKRGRNQKSGSVPKNALLSDYKYATGFEALVGYLHLIGAHDRLETIVCSAIEAIEREDGSENS